MLSEPKRFDSPLHANALESSSRKEIKIILDTLPDGIWVCDGSGKILIINSASERLNQIEASAYIGRNVDEAVREGLMDHSVTLDVINKKRQVSIMQHSKSTDKHLLVTGIPAVTQSGKISLVVVNERDISQLNAAKRALEKARQVGKRFKDEVTALNLHELTGSEIVADNPSMRDILRTGMKLANQEVSNILLLGESGAGKGVLAKFIHKAGPRRNESFIHVNCAALPETLLEAELFGYERGAFTGASEAGKAGLFELANGGTLFLDEIGDMPLLVQAKLLTYLDNRKVLRLGGVDPKKINCMVIAATNKDLVKRVKEKRFRLDLYYRLNSFTLQIPPLRDRREDIFALTQHFLKQYNDTYGCQRRISSSAFEALQRYAFPGNVRELNSIIKKAVVLSESQQIDNQVLDALSLNEKSEECSFSAPTVKPSSSLEDQLASLEKEILANAVARHKTTRKVASFLGISQTSIVRKLKKYGLK